MPVEWLGRSSSHFTRVARIFAFALSVPHTFRRVFDGASLDAATSAGNPANDAACLAVINDLRFAVLPPRTEQRAAAAPGSPPTRRARCQVPIPAAQWFQYGCCAWRFTDSGTPRSTLGTAVQSAISVRKKANLSPTG